MGSCGIEKRVVLVTGSARGLGLEIARALAEAGAVVYINGRDRHRLQLAVERLRKENIEVLPVVFDVADEEAYDAALDEILASQGRFDVLVNNVGIRLREPLDKIDGAAIRNVLNHNVVAPFMLSKRCAPMMAKGNYGRIINISSAASERGRSGDAAYIIAKGALNALTLALAAEFAPQGITCNAILPGAFLTETNAEAFKVKEMQERLQSRILLGRAGEPWEICSAALFLASPGARYVTGILLPVDGGYLAAG